MGEKKVKEGNNKGKEVSPHSLWGIVGLKTLRGKLCHLTGLMHHNHLKMIWV